MKTKSLQFELEDGATFETCERTYEPDRTSYVLRRSVGAHGDATVDGQNPA